MREDKIRILKEILDYAFSNQDENLFFCPFCKHHKPKLSVNIEKDVFKCWICDTYGKNIFFIIKRFGNHRQVDQWSVIDGREDLCDFESIFFGKEQGKLEQIVHLPDEFISLTKKKLPLSAIQASNYLIKRGITQEDILKWKIGYCVTGEYQNRIIIPSFNERGNINYFISRTYTNDWMRYKNPPVSRDITFNELSIDWREDVIIVEGVFDAIKAGNAIPILGSTIREKSNLFQKIVEHSPRLFFALDADAEKKSISIMRKFINYGLQVYKVKVPEDKDVGDMSKEEFNCLKESAKSLDTDLCFMELALSMV